MHYQRRANVEVGEVYTVENAPSRGTVARRIIGFPDGDTITYMGVYYGGEEIKTTMSLRSFKEWIYRNNAKKEKKDG
jgi:hypothetical protein